VDRDLTETGQPYAFTGDDPLNATDPLGDFSLGHLVNPCDWGNACRHVHNAAKKVQKAITHNAVEHDLVDMPQDASYLQYWASYVAIKKAKQLGSHVPGGSAVATALTAPLVPLEAAGLGGQALGSMVKGETVWQQDQGNQPLFGHQTGGVALSEALANVTGSNVPIDMTFPGFNHFDHSVDFEW
jgi:hypothetical protein